MNKTTVHVAIALLFHQGQVLVGWRQAKQHQGNKYEFPGGKVETDEIPIQACRRETLEEVGIDIAQWHVFDDIFHEYDDLNVHLHMFHATVDSHQLNQILPPWEWYSRNQLVALNFPKANDAIIQRLVWPESIAIMQHLNVDADAKSDQYFLVAQMGNHDVVQALLSMSDEMKSRWIIHLEVFDQLPSVEQKKYAAVFVGAVELNSCSDKPEQGIEHSIDYSNTSVALPTGVKTVAYCHNAQHLKTAIKIGCDAIIYLDGADLESMDTEKANVQQAQDYDDTTVIVHQTEHLTSKLPNYFLESQSCCHVPVYL